jgi:hypothetical protein
MMRRFSISAILIAFSIVTLPTIQHHADAQDVTITVTKTDKDSDKKPPFTGTRPAVDIAILLDTSNSMDGLIAQAKSQLWSIIQQFADAKKAGKTPVLRVSVFEYGNTNLPASEGYIRQVVQLTDDLDKVSEVLFALRTNGGDEYCGQVIQQAIKRLDWSGEPNGYKAIFIAGNEPFTQGSVNYKDSCKSAIENGIVVNTIHCGDYETGVRTHWKDGADLAEGTYLNIDQDRKVVHIQCPQDKIIIQLNSELNKTYLWFGSKDVRESYSENQIAQDNNALRVGGGGGFGGGRGVTKASALYRNAGRDLVDTLEEDSEILTKLKKDQLPREMQGMSVAQRIDHINKMAAKRAEIKSKIGELGRQREAFVVQKRKEMASELGADTLGDVIGAAVRKQLQSSGFELQN